MRKFIYIIISAVLFATSCEKVQPNGENAKLPIFRGYMQFSTGVSTRAQLVTSMKGKSFGVIGYQYSNTSFWDWSKSITAPSTFYNQRVNCDANGVCTYDYENSSASYGDNPKQWDDYRYAFFAYHPYGGSGISLSSQSETNTPTITYGYGWQNETGTINLCSENILNFDLMTAEAVDVNGSGTGRVPLDFKHRMFALEILANNYNENTYEYIVDGNGDYVLDAQGNKQFLLDNEGNKIIAESAQQQITNLTLTLNGLTNTSMVIPLSMRAGEDDPVYTKGNVGERKFKISDETVIIPAFNETTDDGRGEGVATSISHMGSVNGGYLFLIPQEGSDSGITGTLDWVELEYFQQANGNEGVNTEFNSTMEFKPGKLYQVYINFVGSGITITLIEAGNWDVLDITHTFE